MIHSATKGTTGRYCFIVIIDWTLNLDTVVMCNVHISYVHISCNECA